MCIKESISSTSTAENYWKTKLVTMRLLIFINISKLQII